MDPEAVGAGVRLGEVIAGKYRIERVIGVGGMGVVVAAYHVELHERVALKFLLPIALTNREATERFVREARAAVKIKSEHVARVIDVGKRDDGSPYIVMEYLEGSDLASLLVESGPLGVEQAVDVVLQTCEALAEAHALGIVHRDLKPANLFSLKRAHGQHLIKVLDFGISKAIADSTGLSMTRSGVMIGTPAYMSPEQIHASGGVDMRADVWALGVILFELLTGEPPFTGDTMPELAMRITYAEPSQIAAGLPQGLMQAIARCLEKDREQRFQTVGELALVLKEFGPRHARRSVERVLATLAAAGLSPIDAVPSSTRLVIAPRELPEEIRPPASAAHAEPAQPPPRRKGAAVVGALVVAALVAAAIFLVSRPGPRPGATEVPASMVRAVESSSAALASASSSATVADARTGADSAPVPAVPAPVASAAAPVPAVPAPVASAEAPPLRPSAPSGRGTAAPAANPECRPPFYIDAVGHRQYKPECL